MLCSNLRPSLPHLFSMRLLGTAATRTAAVKQPELLPASLTFEDPSAFRVKSLGELLRALGVFRLCSFPVLVNNCGKVGPELIEQTVSNAAMNCHKLSLYISNNYAPLLFFHLFIPNLSCPFQMMTGARILLGRRGFSLLLRPTVYAQFVAGENEKEISQSMGKMSLLGLRPMLAVPIEEDLGESTG